MTATHPVKEIVRHYMQQRRTERAPVPTLEEIRRVLGWKLIEAERAVAGK